MEKDFILNGVHIGEHSFQAADIEAEMMERCVKRGYNFVTIRTPQKAIPREYFVRWASFLAEHQIYFVFLYTIQNAPEGVYSHLDAETVAKMKEVAGEYFLGDMLGEIGSALCCKLPGYYKNGVSGKTELKTFETLGEAHRSYVETAAEMVKFDKEIGVPHVFTVEATGLNQYNGEAGVDIPTLELMCGSPDLLVSSLRGVARAQNAKMWGTYVAHEWYGGLRHEDGLKRKRLQLAYRYAYLAGSQIFCLESGDEEILSFGFHRGKDSILTADYRAVMDEMRDRIQEDERPKGGPIVKVAFATGLHDAYGGWGASSLWNQFYRPEWGHGNAEFSYRILDSLYTKRPWHDVHNYGSEDTSAAPAMGLYDMVPVEDAPLSVLSRYDTLIYLGWNTMTPATAEKLTAYVEGGGHLLMGMAHLNTSDRRGGDFSPIGNAYLEKLFGASYTGKTICTNNGVKFHYEEAGDRYLFPATRSLECDPLFSAGFTHYAEMQVTSGKVIATLSDSFKDDSQGALPAVIQKKQGKGEALLFTGTDYPGAPEVTPLYSALVREMISATNRGETLRVLGNDRLRYAVYEGGKIYLLNTDYDFPIRVRIKAGERETKLQLAPLELRSVTL